MENRYVGDVGDLGKHGLLRRLNGLTDPEAGEPDLRLGLVWYAVPDERHPPGNRARMSADGRHISYLRRTARDDRAEYRDPDPELWERLRDLVYRDGRCLHCAETAGLLPEGTQYWSAALVYLPGSPRALREAMRTAWLRGALRATAEADLVMLDPDNGLAREDRRFRHDGPKYAYMSDLRAFWERRQSLVVYQHMPMDRKAHARTREVAGKLRTALGVQPISLLFHRGTARTFFVLPRPEARGLLGRRARAMANGPWGRHFEWVQ